MQKINRDYYINFSFGLILFIFSSYFLEDYVFHTISAWQTGFISLICAPSCFGLAYAMRNKNLGLKIGLLAGIMILLIIVGRIIRHYTIKKPQTPEMLFKGEWISREDGGVSTGLSVNDSMARMIFKPMNKEIDYSYKFFGREIDFFNNTNSQDLAPGEKNEPEMKWEIIKLNPDTLSITWEQQAATFVRGK